MPVLLCGLALVAAGCRPAPSITTGTEEVSDEAEPDLDLPEPAADGVRILGAFVEDAPTPAGPAWRVFKLRGGPAAVGKRAADFDRFLATMRVPAGKEYPDWTLPPGWRVAPPTDPISKLNIRTSHQLTPVDFTYSEVSGELAANVNRWEDQAGVPQTPADKLAAVWKESVTADGKKVYRLDLKGAGGKKNAMTPPFAKN